MFTELFATAPDAMIVVDSHGRIVRANAQAERLFGYREEELRGEPVEILIPEDVRQAHRFHREKYVSNPRVRPMGSGQELVGLKRDGQKFPVEIALSPYAGAAGTLYVASVRDISETQRARQALARAKYDGAIARVGRDLLAASNLDLAALPILEVVASTLDVDAAAFIVKNAQTAQMQARGVYGVAEAVIEKLPWTLALRSAQRLRDGNNAPINDSALADSGFHSTYVFPLFDHDVPTGALLVLSKEWREFDRDAVHFLQSTANFLSAAMQRIRTEEQLSHAQRLEAVGQLTGGVAHDFNNLLTVITGNLQLLEGLLAQSPEGRTIVSGALRAVERGADLTRKLLTFARRQQLSPRACEPRVLLNDLGKMLQRTLGETITLEVDCPPDLAAVFADPAHLDSALVNLALNSRDAMPRGGILSISAAKGELAPAATAEDVRAGEYVVFSVRDTGGGMTEDVLARAFEPFFTTKDHGKGSGLGLSMVHGFVKQSGGHLTVESQLGYGTCIRMHLPAAVGPRRVEGERTGVSSPGGGESVLVVEDEPDVRQIAVVFLRSLGYCVLAVANAEEALQVLATHRTIDVVFSDMTLGSGMTGRELADEIRIRFPAMRVLLTTGYESSPEQNDPDLRYEVLPKPYRREELSFAVKRCLGNSPRTTSCSTMGS